MGRFFVNLAAFKVYIEECAYTAEAQSTVFLRFPPTPSTASGQPRFKTRAARFGCILRVPGVDICGQN